MIIIYGLMVQKVNHVRAELLLHRAQQVLGVGPPQPLRAAAAPAFLFPAGALAPCPLPWLWTEQ